MEPVLVIYNDFACAGGGFEESRAGVMDQVRAVTDALEKLGIDHETQAVTNLRHLAALLLRRKERLIFNLAEEIAGAIREAAYVPALCESFGVGCTGSSAESLFLALNKVHAKAVLQAAGLPVPPGAHVEPGLSLDAAALPPGRYIVKPACTDASEGIEADSVIDIPSPHADTLVRRIHERFGQAAVVERFIPDRELNVSVIEHGGKPRVMPLAEIDFSAFNADQPKIVDYAAKWLPDSFGFNNTPRKIPADLPEPVAQEVRDLAVRAWAALSCRDYARVDFRLDERMQPYVLEVNPNPDISMDAGFAAALAAGSVAYDRFVWLMLQNAAARRDKQKIPNIKEKEKP